MSPFVWKGPLPTARDLERDAVIRLWGELQHRLREAPALHPIFRRCTCSPEEER